MSEEELICPHCGREQLCHEPDVISAYVCSTECEHCGQPFWYSVSVIRTYAAYTDSDIESKE